MILDEPGACHDWPLLPLFEPRKGCAGRGMDRIVEFLSAHARDRPSEQVFQGGSGWERQKWISFYDGSYAPHLAIKPKANAPLPSVNGADPNFAVLDDAVIGVLPWRSKAPISQLVKLATAWAKGRQPFQDLTLNRCLEVDTHGLPLNCSALQNYAGSPLRETHR